MNIIIKLLFKLDNFLAKTEGVCAVSILIVMLGFASLQVILRNFFHTGVEWGDVFVRHLVLWVGFFGATISSKKNQHIRIDALTKVIPPRFLPLVEIFVALFCIIVASLLTMAAYKFMSDERMASETLFLNVKTWVMISIMPIGFGIITFRHFIQLIEYLYKFAGQKISTNLIPEGPSDSSELEISVKIKLT